MALLKYERRLASSECWVASGVNFATFRTRVVSQGISKLSPDVLSTTRICCVYNLQVTCGEIYMILQYIRLWLGNNSARKHHGTCHCNFQKTSRIIVWKSYISRTRTSNMALCTTETNQKETKLGRRKTSPEFAAENCGPGKALIAYETLRTFASRANP